MNSFKTLQLDSFQNIFETIAGNCYMINDFGFGPIFNINAAVGWKYPLMYVEPVRGTADRSGNIGGGRIQLYKYTFNVYILDKIINGDKNYDQILSDTQQIVESIIIDIDNSNYFWDKYINTEGNIDFTPIYETLVDDNVNGWVASITFRTPNRFSVCNIPIASLTNLPQRYGIGWMTIGTTFIVG